MVQILDNPVRVNRDLIKRGGLNDYAKESGWSGAPSGCEIPKTENQGRGGVHGARVQVVASTIGAVGMEAQ